MRILLLGREGQLGWELQRSLSVLGELVALGRDAAHNPRQLCGELGDTEGLRRTVAAVEPDAIVNAAAWTDVDRAEAEPAAAHAANATGPATLAAAAERCGAWLLHFSTDYVFDGTGDLPWREEDTPAPLNVYGRTKRAGEQAVAAACQRHLILRSSWVFGSRGGNFARTMLRLAGERERLSVVDDQIGAPTAAALLADAGAHALRQAMAQPALAGLYHCTAAGNTSWHGYARFVLEQAQARGWPLKTGPAQVAAIASSDWPTPARRPLNSQLDCRRFRTRFGLHLPHWQHHVRRLLQELAPPPLP